MSSPALTLDASRTTLEIRTLAEGALSALAHNLALLATHLTGNAEPGPPARATVQVPIDGLVVRGVVRDWRVDDSVLSPFERREIEKRIRHDVFRDVPTLTVRAGTEGDRCHAEIGWGDHVCNARFPVTMSAGKDGTRHATGRVQLSLAGLGIKPIHGPLHAFRVADLIEIRFDAVFQSLPIDLHAAA